MKKGLINLVKVLCWIVATPFLAFGLVFAVLPVFIFNEIKTADIQWPWGFMK